MMTKLQLKAIQISLNEIALVYARVSKLEFDIKKIRENISKIRSASDEAQNDLNLLKIHDDLDKLIDKSVKDPLNNATDWICNLNE